MINVIIGGATGRMGRMLTRAVLESGDLNLAGATGIGEDLGRDAGEVAGQGQTGITIVAPEKLAAGDVSADTVLVDFSLPAGFSAHLNAALNLEIPMVSGTTGLSREGQADLRAASGVIPLVWAPNMSLGANILLHLAREAARLCGADFEAEVVELHHRHKVDAPSGTARLLSSELAGALHAAQKDANRGKPFTVHGRDGAVGPRSPMEVGVHALRGGDAVGEHTVMLLGEGERLELIHRVSDRTAFVTGTLRAVRWINGRPPGLYGMDAVLGLTGPATPPTPSGTAL